MNIVTVELIVPVKRILGDLGELIVLSSMVRRLNFTLRLNVFWVPTLHMRLCMCTCVPCMYVCVCKSFFPQVQF